MNYNLLMFVLILIASFIMFDKTKSIIKSTMFYFFTLFIFIYIPNKWIEIQEIKIYSKLWKTYNAKNTKDGQIYNITSFDVNSNDSLDEMLDSFKDRYIITEKYKIDTKKLSLNHKIGDEVNCIMPIVLSWDNGEEFTRDDAVTCTVLKVRVDTSTLKIDCSEYFDKYSSENPGRGLVKNHDLHKKIRWIFEDRCYKVL